jgi:putative inorganic carbon (HCO3(-)) transporter
MIGATVAASLFYTPLPFVILIAIPSCLYFLSRPYELLLVMVFLIPFNFAFTVGPVPLAVELLKVFAWIPFLIDRRNHKTPLRTSRYNKLFAVWAVILLVSLFRSSSLLYTIKEVVRLGSSLGLCYLVLNLVDTERKLFQVLRVLTVSTLLVALYGFYQFAIQDYGALFWIVNPRMDTNMAPGRYVFWEWRNRIISVLTSEMELGHYFNMCIPIGVVLWLTEGRRRIGSKWLVMVLAMLLGLVLTFTFGAWLALAATTAIFVFQLDKKRRWGMIVAGISVLAIAALALVYGPLRSFAEAKIAGTEMGSFAWDVFTRLDAWVFAAQTWWAHPFFGVGVGNYQAIEAGHQLVASPWAEGGSTPHETYLYLLAVGGLIGFSTMLVILLGTIRANFRIAKHSELGLVALGLAFALVVNMIGWFSDDSTFVGPHAGYLLWLFVGLSESVRNLSLFSSPLQAN